MENLAETQMTSPNTLTDFIKWSAASLSCRQIRTCALESWRWYGAWFRDMMKSQSMICCRCRRRNALSVIRRYDLESLWHCLMGMMKRHICLLYMRIILLHRKNMSRELVGITVNGLKICLTIRQCRLSKW